MSWRKTASYLCLSGLWRYSVQGTIEIGSTLETRCKKQETCLPTGRLDSVLLLNKSCLRIRISSCFSLARRGGFLGSCFYLMSNDERRVQNVEVGNHWIELASCLSALSSFCSQRRQACLAADLPIVDRQAAKESTRSLALASFFLPLGSFFFLLAKAPSRKGI